MKTMQKVLVLVVAVAMLFNLAVFASAAEEYTITIKNADDGHTYAAYQIFEGKLAEDKNTLTGIDWGNGVKSAALLAALKADETFGKGEENLFNSCTTAAEVAAVLETADSSDVAKEFARVATMYTDGDGATGTDSITVNETGYYLVVDTTTGKSPISLSMLTVVGDSIVTVKSGTPEVDKQVYDQNDSLSATDDGDYRGWDETADHDMGDSVPFKLIGTLPSNYDAYKTYIYVFHDTMSKGLTYNGDAKVYAVKDNEKIEIDDTSYVVSTGDADDDDPRYEGGSTLTVSFEDLKAATSDGEALELDDSYSIVVEYTATLNEEANIGVAGNPNKVKLEYSNNPNWTGDGTPDNPPPPPTEETPEDTVIVFTYELDADKVDGSNNNDALEGVDFTLYKWYEQGVDLPKNASYATGDGVPATPDGKTAGGWVSLGTKQSTLNDEGKAEFGWKGLDDGDYVLVEENAPAGYNEIDPIYFTISAVQDNVHEELVSVTFTPADGSAADITSGVEGSGKVGVGTTTIVNNRGAKLPSTGGFGTTLFYIIGGLTVVFTGILLVTKRRMKGLV